MEKTRQADMSIEIIALNSLPDIVAGHDLAALLATALAAKGGIGATDILVVAQKIVSKAEGRAVALSTVTPSPRAHALAATTGKDPRVVELILGESEEVMRAVPGVLISRHRLGHVMANAGIDHSNVGLGEDMVLLLPIDPDGSARHIRDGLRKLLGTAPGLLISDSFGRAWRNGVVNVAIGVAGLAPLVDRRGTRDRYGRLMETTEVATADALAAAAGLVMGEAAEGCPAALIRGMPDCRGDGTVGQLLRPRERDLFP